MVPHQSVALPHQLSEVADGFPAAATTNHAPMHAGVEFTVAQSASPANYVDCFTTGIISYFEGLFLNAFALGPSSLATTWCLTI